MEALPSGVIPLAPKTRALDPSLRSGCVASASPEKQLDVLLGHPDTRPVLVSPQQAYCGWLHTELVEAALKSSISVSVQQRLYNGLTRLDCRGPVLLPAAALPGRRNQHRSEDSTFQAIPPGKAKAPATLLSFITLREDSVCFKADRLTNYRAKLQGRQKVGIRKPCANSPDSTAAGADHWKKTCGYHQLSFLRTV